MGENCQKKKRENNAYHIRKSVRDMVVYTIQNVIEDPPFSKLDLISCRNLLIYLGRDGQMFRNSWP
ncbi:MAG: hypothetical protein D6775_12260 [Caldilineae bacterium]|nr:MAG: hypothetical protein D6775_12260 [Caldilineae bacterium]